MSFRFAAPDGRVLGALLLAFFCFTAAGVANAAPTLVWEKETVELKPDFATAYRTGAVLEGRFPFVNPGSEPVEIVAVEPDCGCTTAELTPRTIAPGGRSEVVAKFTVADRSGRQEKHIAVRAKSDAGGQEAVPVARLTFIIHLPDLLRAEPEMALHWSLGEAGKPQTIVLTPASEELPIERITVQSSQALFQPQLRTVEAGRRYELTVTPVRTDLLFNGNLPLSCTFRAPDSGESVQPVSASPPPVRVYNVTASVVPPGNR